MRYKLEMCKRREIRRRYFIKERVQYDCIAPIVVEVGTHPKYGSVGIIITAGFYNGNKEDKRKDLYFRLYLEVWNKDNTRITISGRGHSVMDACYGNGVDEAIKDSYDKLVKMYWSNMSSTKTNFEAIKRAVRRFVGCAIDNGGRVYRISYKELSYRVATPFASSRWLKNRYKYVHRHINE